MNRIVGASAATLVWLLASCGGNAVRANSTGTPTAAPTAATTPAPSIAPTAAPTAGAEVTASSTAPATPASPPPSGVTLVTPRPGMSHVHQVSWRSAELVGPRTVRVMFYAGLEPCSVLDSVKVEYRRTTIVITLFSGSDPAQPDRMCAAIARATAVDVALSQDPAGRPFVDGSIGTTHSPASTSPGA